MLEALVICSIAAYFIYKIGLRTVLGCLFWILVVMAVVVLIISSNFQAD